MRTYLRDNAKPFASTQSFRGEADERQQKPNWRLETVAVHGGYRPDPTTRAVAVPIYQTVAYAFDDTQHGADLFDLKVAGNIYTRIMNPTTDVLEQRVAALEGGIAALALASSQAAVTYAILTIAEGGRQHRLVQHAVWRHLQPVRPHAAAVQHHRFADPRDIGSFEKQINERTKAIFAESVGNPLGNITDIAALAELAHRRPAADRRQHRALAVPAASDRARRGHRGAVADQVPGRSWHQPGRRHHRLGQVPWAEHKARFKRLNEPDISYHGVVYTGPSARPPISAAPA